MYSGGRSQPSSHRQTSNSRSRAPSRSDYRIGIATYSHIQTIAPPDSDAASASEQNANTKRPSPIIRIPSLVEDLNKLAEGKLDSRAPAYKTPTGEDGPLSFANIAAMIPQGRPPGFGSRHAPDPDAEVPPPAGPVAISTLGPYKLSSKHKKQSSKKWSPLDLETLNKGNAVQVTTNLRSKSIPTFSTPDRSQAVTVVNPYPPLPPSGPSSYSTPTAAHKGKGPANRPPLFRHHHNSRSLHLQNPPPPPVSGHSLAHQDDSEETKNLIENIMSRMDEAFDIQEWDPNLSGGANSNSPERLEVKREPLSYTTVGSLVKSNAVPQFTAPVRIQREGAGRRLAITGPQGRVGDGFHGRGGQIGNSNHSNMQFMVSQQSAGVNTGSMQVSHPRSSIQNASNYAEPQQISRDTLFQHIQGLPTDLSDEEKDVILRALGLVPSLEQNVLVSTSVRDFVVQDPAAATVNFKEEIVGQSSASMGSLSGLEKMQTLQRLAQFPNPKQQFAKERLAEFAIVKDKMKMTMDPDISPRSHQQPPLSLTQQSGKNTIMQVENASHLDRKGTLDLDYRFPQKENENPLRAAAMGYGNNIQSSTNASGYPQPLTAGPPGQRQNAISVQRNPWGYGYDNSMEQNEYLNQQGNQSHQSSFNQQSFNQGSAHTSSHYGSQYHSFVPPAQNAFSSVITEDNHLRDSLRPLDATRYYPHGLPNEIGIKQTSISDDDRKRNLGQAIGPPKTRQQTYEEKLNNCFYSGLKRFGMTADEHLNEMESKEIDLKYPHFPKQPPIARPNIKDREVLSVQDVQKKTEAECAAPILDAAFGTLLSYADKVISPNNASMLSKFEPAAPWTIDTSKDGNNSYFGDDGWAPPKRLGRDPRYRDAGGDGGFGSSDGRGTW